MSQGITLFNETMEAYLIQNKRYLLHRPGYLRTFAKISRNIRRQENVRAQLLREENLTVPPVLIISVTNDCNLKCKGCYANSQNRDKQSEMSTEDILRTVGEAVTLGVSVVLIAGGEPLMKEGILNLPKAHPETLFVMFTNGLMLTKDKLESMRKTKNLIPVISIEGSKQSTDSRRGKGMYRAVMQIMARLNTHRRLFGTSITITSTNFDEVLRGDYLSSLKQAGCRTVFLIEYVPTADDFDLCLTDEQKAYLIAVTDTLIAQHDMLIVPLPGNEDKYGGCLAAGRGFIHISSTGSLEACPFAPFSDTNVKNMPLSDALKSRLLSDIRDNHSELKESRGGCALQENKEWVASLMRDRE